MPRQLDLCRFKRLGSKCFSQTNAWRRKSPRTREAEAQAQALALPAHRAESQNVISTSQLQITSEIRAEKDRDRVVNLETRTRLSHFLQAVFLGDYTAAIEVLERFRTACTRSNHTAKSVEIYTTCFATLLTQACRAESKMPSMPELSALVAAADAIPKGVKQSSESSHPRSIQSLLVLVLLKKLQATPENNRITRVNLIAYIRGLATRFSLSSSDIFSKLQTTSPVLVAEYNQVFHCNEISLELAGDKKTELQNASERLKKGNHAHSFDSLCMFIENRSFDTSAYSGTQDTKYHQIFDLLSGEDRRTFFDAYLAHNYEKQLLIEDASQNVYKAVSGSSQMFGFSSAHKQWIKTWLSAANEKINASVGSDPDLKKFAFVFDHLSEDHVVSSCLTHMLSSTVLVSSAKVLPLAKKIGHSLRKELGVAGKSTIPQNAQEWVFSNDHAIEFACTILNVLMTVSKLPDSSATSGSDSEDWAGKVFRLIRVKDEENPTKFVRYGAIKIHPVVAEHFKIYQELFQAGEYRFPMIHPPKQWTSPKDGGFYSIRLPLVKSSEPSASDTYMDRAHETGQLSSVYSAVNALGSCAWTINESTFSVFDAMWKTQSLHGLPKSLTPTLQETGPLPSAKEYIDETEFKSALAKWKKVKLENEKETRDVHNLHAYYSMIHRLAKSFAKNGDVLYLPHDMDFRGRVYPAVSFLSHQSEDLVRSLLMFWEAKPLGPEGYDWLSYQLANLFSKTKMTMEQSKSFVQENKDLIVQSASDPEAEDAWWLKADTPWQTLALCREFRKIWNFKGDVSTFLSRIPIHQDGSCNGLQHYAALGADSEAAKAVNVLPADQMQDVYTTVLDLVRARVTEDARTTEKSPRSKKVAKSALQVLSRKLIKQTVMTTVYGVTPYGATKQVQGQIQNIAEADSRLAISHEERVGLASYIAQQVLGSISRLFSGAKLIQNWLVANCARSIQGFDARNYPKGEPIDFFAGKFYRPMMWTSLSGFPVIQMYRKRATREIHTPLQKLCLNDDTRLAPIDLPKSKNGIAPNFIHSIDAIHLLMTCLSAKSENITFAAVHDSFWTHPSEVEVLSRVLREEFARLHGSDIIGNLRCDLMHVNRKSFQLVWANKISEASFIADLTELRKQYPIENKTRASLKWFNACLAIELENHKAVKELIGRHEPTLLWEQSGASSPVVYNKISVPETRHERISTKTHVPLLVPVEILEAPKVGTLDIKSVLQSKYFFS